MEIFMRIPKRGYEIVRCTTSEDYKTLRTLDGTPRRNWKPVLVKRDQVMRQVELRPADLPFCMSAFILRRSAVDALRDILEANGELLPLATEDGLELYVLNVRAIHALDVPRSKVIYDGETGMIANVEDPVFVRSAIEGVDIFTLKNRLGLFFFSDRFVTRTKKAKLKGVDFGKVWSSDD